MTHSEVRKLAENHELSPKGLLARFYYNKDITKEELLAPRKRRKVMIQGKGVREWSELVTKRYQKYGYSISADALSDRLQNWKKLHPEMTLEERLDHILKRIHKQVMKKAQ